MKRDRMFEDAPIIETRAVNEREQVASMPMFAYRRKKKAKEKNNDYDDDYPYRSQATLRNEGQHPSISLKRNGLDADHQHIMNSNNTHGLTPRNYKNGRDKKNPFDSLWDSRMSSPVKAKNQEEGYNQLLKDIITRNKVRNLCYQFVDKIKRNNPNLKPAYYDGFDKTQIGSIEDLQGFEPPQVLVNLSAFIHIVLVFALIFLYTMELVFPEFRDGESIFVMEIVSIFFFSLEILFNLLTKKTKSGRKLSTLRQIFFFNLETVLIIDIIVVIVIAISLAYSQGVLLFLRLTILLKLPQTMDRVQKLEVAFIRDYYHEQYWSLVKIAFFNICFAHILAIILNTMAQIDPNDNWYQNKGISNLPWFPKYVWAAYWGVNIMMTVGFGDISAVNHIEALCLIFIQIFAVIALTYNISLIGNLIGNIRQKDIEKSRNQKTFHRLNERYELPSDLEVRISNFIEKSANMRKKFNAEEENQFIKSLPKTMRRDYLKETNKGTFQKIVFFSSLATKTLNNFAEKIQMSIVHPQEIIRKIDDSYNLLILKEGEVGYVVKKPNCNFTGMVVDKVKVGHQEKPAVLNLSFITRVRPIYETKSIQYSAIFSMSNEDLISVLRQSQADYQHYCFLRDKNKAVPDEFEVFTCEVCNNGQRHTKFTCPKLHFIPLNLIVIQKELFKEKTYKNKRTSTRLRRIQAKQYYALKLRKEMDDLFKNLPHESKMNPDSKASLLSKHIIQSSKFLASLQTIEPSLKSFNSIKIKDQKQKDTKDVIKEQLRRMNRAENQEDEVWLVECDKVQNYNKYFPEGNSSNLEYTFEMDERLKNLEKDLKQNKRKIQGKDTDQKIKSARKNA